jgi:hypothetical protein
MILGDAPGEGRGYTPLSPKTTAWFALRLGPSEYAMDLFDEAPQINQADVLAAKLPGVPAQPSEG